VPPAQAELTTLLRGLHLAGSDGEVARKADTCMDAGDSDRDGFLSYDDFARLADRFPKILFPTVGGAAGAGGR
jgi:hypothetical protein